MTYKEKCELIAERVDKEFKEKLKKWDKINSADGFYRYAYDYVVISDLHMYLSEVEYNGFTLEQIDALLKCDNILDSVKFAFDKGNSRMLDDVLECIDYVICNRISKQNSEEDEA